MKYITILLMLIGFNCYGQDCTKLVNGVKVPCDSSFLAQRQIDSLADVKDKADRHNKKASYETLVEMYDAQVYGKDVRTLNTAQQRIALAILLYRYEMVDTNFRMK